MKVQSTNPFNVDADVAKVAVLLAQVPGVDDDAIVNLAAEEKIDRELAALAVAFIPVAFGRLIIRESDWSLHVPDMFIARASNGKWCRYRLSQNTTYQAAS